MIEGKDTGFVDYLYNNEYDYLVPFQVQLNADIHVELRLGIEVLELDEGTDYTIVEVDGNRFVSLTVDAEYPFEPEVLGISREMSLTQPYSFDSGESIVRRYLEDALDRLILLIQSLTRGISGALFFPTNEDVDPYIPSNVERRNNYLAFDEDGEMIVWVDGYDKLTTEIIHEPALLTTSAVDHNTYYGTNDQEGFLPSQEGQLKGSVLMTLEENPEETAYKSKCFLEGGDSYTDYIEIRDNTTGEIIRMKDEHISRTPLSADMMMMWPAGEAKPSGLTYEHSAEYDGEYAVHANTNVDGYFTQGQKYHNGGASLEKNAWAYAHQKLPGYPAVSSTATRYYYYDNGNDIPSHTHTVPAHSHNDTKENEMDRYQMHAMTGVNKVTSGMLFMALHGVTIPDCVDETAANNKYLKFVDESIAVTSVIQPAHSHTFSYGGGDPLLLLGRDTESTKRIQLDQIYWYTWGYCPTQFHTHFLPSHETGLSTIEAPYRNMRLVRYTGPDIDYIPGGLYVMVKPGGKTPLGTQRVIGDGNYMRFNSSAGTGGASWHEHNAIVNSDPPFETEDRIGNYYDGAVSGHWLWNGTGHTHSWNDDHADVNVFPEAGLFNLFLATRYEEEHPSVTHADVESPGVMGAEYGLLSAVDNTKIVRFGLGADAVVHDFNYSTSGLQNKKIYKDGLNALILANPVSSYSGHMIAYSCLLDEAGFNPTQILASNNYTFSNSDYCASIESQELYHILGNGTLEIYDMSTLLKVREMKVPAGCFQAEWSDYYYGIVAIMQVEGVYSLVYIRPEAPGVAVYICDTYPMLTSAPHITPLGRDGGLCVIMDTGSLTARIYFDLDKSYDFALTGSGDLVEVAWLSDTSALKIVCENFNYSTVIGPAIKSGRQAVKSFLPYIDMAITEWIPEE